GLNAVLAQRRSDHVENGTELRAVADREQLRLHEQHEVIALVRLTPPERDDPLTGCLLAGAEFRYGPDDIALKTIFAHRKRCPLSETRTPPPPGVCRRRSSQRSPANVWPPATGSCCDDA